MEMTDSGCDSRINISTSSNRIHKRTSRTRVLPRSNNTASSYFDARNVMRPIYDTKTKNKSFIEVSEQLRLNGVKNHQFHLLLLNPLLQGVDPYSENLTSEQVVMIVQECKLNMYYYLREVVRIEEQGGGLVPFRMDRGTLAASYHFLNNINFYLMKPRQTGKTVGVLAMLSWAFKFQGPNADMLFSCYKEELTKKNLRGMRTIIRNLPSYLSNLGVTKVDNSGKTIRKTDNAKSYREPTSNNSAMVAQCASTPDAADTVGRGYTQVYQYFDEAEFTKYIDTIVKVSGMAFNTASRNAAKNKSGYCRIFTTTPGDLSNEKTCQSAMKIVKDAIVWKESFYDEDISAYKHLIKHKSSFRVVYIEYDYKSLGLGEDWFEDACHQVGYDVDKIKREILLMRFHGNSNSPFTNDEIEDLVNNQKAPIAVKTVNRIYDILFYEKPKKGRLYFFGIDPSEGTGGDNYAITVIDPYELSVVAEFKSSYMTVDGCVDLVTWMVEKYFNKCLLIIERNRNGGAVVQTFRKSKLRDRVYCSPKANDDTIRISDNLDENGFIKEQFVRNKYFGTNTTTTTRQVMMNILLDAVHFSRNLLTSKYIVEDIKNLVVKNNKIQAADGKHDDSIMSWLIAIYIYYHGEKLDRYGFDKTRLPGDVYEDDEFDELSKLYANPEIKKQFPSFYNFYLEKKKLHDINVKKHKQELLKTFEPKKIGGIDNDAFDKAEQQILPDIDDVDEFTKDTAKHEQWKKSIIRDFMSLNKM